jgi:hypothetical protein
MAEICVDRITVCISKMKLLPLRGDYHAALKKNYISGNFFKRASFFFLPFCFPFSSIAGNVYFSLHFVFYTNETNAESMII